MTCNHGFKPCGTCPTWIKVEDRLGRSVFRGVTHWQPLPEAPR